VGDVAVAAKRPPLSQVRHEAIHERVDPGLVGPFGRVVPAPRRVALAAEWTIARIAITAVVPA